MNVSSVLSRRAADAPCSELVGDRVGVSAGVSAGGGIPDSGARSRLPTVVPMAVLIAAVTACGLCALLGAGGAFAQTSEDVRTMTPDQLEAHIADEKARLETVIENRDITEQKAEAIEAELAEREAKQAEVEAEMRDLCESQDAIEPGTLDDCLAQLDG